MRRYAKMVLLDVDTCAETVLILSTKIGIKIGYRYTVYFDRPVATISGQDNAVAGFVVGGELPTDGYIGFINHGIYVDNTTTNPDGGDIK